MDTTLENLIVRLLGDASSYTKMVQTSIGDTSKLESAITGTSKKIEALTSTLAGFGQQAQGILGMLAGNLGIGSILGTVQSAISKAAESESIEIAFRSLIGDAGRAQQALKDLHQFAVETPFEVPQILEAAKSMLAYGTAAEDIVPTMRNLGDVASALNIPLGSLTYLMGTMNASGRVTLIDLRQLANRGIPIYIELAKVLGLADKGVQQLTASQSQLVNQMASKGRISTEQVNQAMRNLTSEGGRFFNMMKDQSKSFNGLISNLKDSLGLLLADVGQQIIDGLDLKRVIKEVGTIAQAFADWFKTMDPQTKKFLFTLLGVIAAAGVLLATFLAIKGVIIGISAIIATVGWPFLAVSALIIGAMALWVNSVGGINKALDIAKEKLLAFWRFIEPIKNAIVELGTAIWESMVRRWETFKSAAIGAWNAVMGTSSTNWDQILSDATDTILLIEYQFLKMEKIAFLVYDSIGKQAGTSLAITWQLVQAQIAALELLAKTAEKFKDILPLFGLAGYLVSGVSADFEGMDKRLKDLPDTFEEFKKQREAMRKSAKYTVETLVETTQSVKNAETKDDMAAVGKDLGRKFGKGFTEGVQQTLDTVLFGSAESVRRLDDYLAQLAVAPLEVRFAGNHPDTLLSHPQNIPLNANTPIGASVEDRNSDVLSVLKEMRDSLKHIEGRPQIDVEGANLGSVGD